MNKFKEEFDLLFELNPPKSVDNVLEVFKSFFNIKRITQTNFGYNIIVSQKIANCFDGDNKYECYSPRGSKFVIYKNTNYNNRVIIEREKIFNTTFNFNKKYDLFTKYIDTIDNNMSKWTYSDTKVINNNYIDTWFINQEEDL